MKIIKLGVIGLGGRGVALAEYVQQHGRHMYEVTAVCDPYPNKVADALRTLALPPEAGFTDYHELLQHPEVEAVMVETGAQIMASISCDALRAGKHVMCDVPMIFTRQDAWDLVVAVEQTGLVYCMQEQQRFGNFVRHWEKYVEQGEIGEPLFIQGEYIHPIAGWYLEDRETGWYLQDHEIGAAAAQEKDLVALVNDPRFQRSWRNTYKHPIKYISHELSPLLKILDDRVAQVSCFASDARMYGDAVEMIDLQCALMQTAKGRSMRIVNSFTAPRGGEYFHHWYQIMGTDGVLETARPDWGIEGEIIRRRNGSVERTNYGWERTDDNPFGGNFAGGHGGMEAFVFQQFYDTVVHNHPNESNVYATVEATLPGIIAAESAESGGNLMEVPDVRPSAERESGSYPKE